MKKLVYILIPFLMLACNSEHANDCFQTSGTIIQKEIMLPSFTKILVNRDIELIIKEGVEQKVVIETGTNLLSDVTATVVDEDKLVLTDNNNCNYFRDYNITKVYVTSPNITEIRSSTQYDVRSDGILTYPSLALLSEDYYTPESFTVGNFHLQLNNNVLSIVFNNLSNCYVSGTTNNLSITFAAGISRFEGANLIAQHVSIWNRSSNDMIVNPQQSLTGKISGTGNVISVNQPPLVDVSEDYKGRLIFN
jgi:hypothetical protein